MLQKKWVVTKDDLLCPTCRTMLEMAPVPLREPFKTPLGPTPYPPLHPNCRCTLSLVRGTAKKPSRVTVTGALEKGIIYQKVTHVAEQSMRYKREITAGLLTEKALATAAAAFVASPADDMIYAGVGSALYRPAKRVLRWLALDLLELDARFMPQYTKRAEQFLAFTEREFERLQVKYPKIRKRIKMNIDTP